MAQKNDKKAKEDRIRREKEAFLQIFENNLCSVTKSCKAANIGRRTFYNWIESDPDFADSVEDKKEEMKDWGEDQLKLLMRGIPELDSTNKLIGWKVKPDTSCVIFFNKTINKDRGYIETSQLQIDKVPEIVVSSEDDKNQIEKIKNRASISEAD